MLSEGLTSTPGSHGAFTTSTGQTQPIAQERPSVCKAYSSGMPVCGIKNLTRCISPSLGDKWAVMLEDNHPAPSFGPGSTAV